MTCLREYIDAYLWYLTLHGHFSMSQRHQMSVMVSQITGYTNVCLTHWCRVTRICVSKLTIIGSDNGLSPGRRQAIIRTNAGILLIGPLGTNFSEIKHFRSEKCTWKYRLRLRPFCLGLSELTDCPGYQQRNQQSFTLLPVVSEMDSPHMGPVYGIFHLYHDLAYFDMTSCINFTVRVGT